MLGIGTNAEAKNTNMTYGQDYYKKRYTTKDEDFVKENFPPLFQITQNYLKDKKEHKDAYHLYNAYRLGIMNLQKGFENPDKFHLKIGNETYNNPFPFYNIIVNQLNECSNDTINSQIAWWYIANALPNEFAKDKLNLNKKEKII